MQIDTSEKAFRAWLVKNAFVTVGRRQRPDDCAYARYLQDQGALSARVGASGHVIIGRNRHGMYSDQYPNPTWLQRFVAHFDTGGRDPEVTGAEALTYLEKQEDVKGSTVPKSAPAKQGYPETLPWGGPLQSPGAVAWKDAAFYGSGGFDPGRTGFKQSHAYA